MNRETISEGIVDFVKMNHLLRGHSHYCALVTMRVDNGHWTMGMGMYLLQQTAKCKGFLKASMTPII